jgi:hypothetical protein
MAVCSADDLLAADPCLYMLDDFALEVVITQSLCNLLDKIVNAGEVTCDVDTLLEQGKCFYAIGDIRRLRIIQAALLCDIAAAL